jgi:hypothetical protein
MRSFIICSHPQISVGRSSQGEWGGQSMWHAWEGREKFTGFWWEIPKERDHAEDRGVDGRMGSEWILEIDSGGCGVDSSGSGYGPVASCCECGDGPSGSSATELIRLMIRLTWALSAIFLICSDSIIVLLYEAPVKKAVVLSPFHHSSYSSYF